MIIGIIAISCLFLGLGWIVAQIIYPAAPKVIQLSIALSSFFLFCLLLKTCMLVSFAAFFGSLFLLLGLLWYKVSPGKQPLQFLLLSLLLTLICHLFQIFYLLFTSWQGVMCFLMGLYIANIVLLILGLRYHGKAKKLAKIISSLTYFP